MSKWLGIQLAALGFLLSTVSGCLEVERAEYCNRVAMQIRAAFPSEKLISKSAERRQLAGEIDKLLGEFSSVKGSPEPYQAELNAFSQELRTLSLDLKRSSQADVPLTLAMKKKISDSLERTKGAAERFRTACH